jgi:hypothetical protein
MTAARALATALQAYLEATEGGEPADRGSHLLDLCDALSRQIDELVSTDTDERLSLDDVVPEGAPTRTPDAVALSGTAFLLGTADSSRPVETALRAYPAWSTVRFPPHVFEIRLPAVLTETQNRQWVRAGIVELRQILFWTWDPYDVQDAFPRTTSEYDALADGLLSELHRGTSTPELARWLGGAEAVLGDDTPTRALQRRQVAERVDLWYDESRSYWLDHQPRPTA